MASFETVSSTVLEKVAEGHTERVAKVIVCVLTRGTFAKKKKTATLSASLNFSLFLSTSIKQQHSAASPSFSTFHPLRRMKQRTLCPVSSQSLLPLKQVFINGSPQI